MARRSAIVLALVAATPLVVVACKTDRTAPTADPLGSASVGGSASASVSVSASGSGSASGLSSGGVETSAPATSVAAVNCDQMFKSMQVGADAALRKFSACTVDTDCVTVPGRVCFGSCDTAINKSGVSEHQRAIKAAQPLCDQFMNGPCMRSFPIAVPTCPMVVPTCDHGACKGKWH